MAPRLDEVKVCWTSKRRDEWIVVFSHAHGGAVETFICGAAALQRRDDVRNGVASSPETLRYRRYGWLS